MISSQYVNTKYEATELHGLSPTFKEHIRIIWILQPNWNTIHYYTTLQHGWEYCRTFKLWIKWTIRKSWDSVYGTWKYRVHNVKQLLQWKQTRGKRKGKTYVIYKKHEQRQKSTEYFSLLYQTHTNCHFKNINLKVDPHTGDTYFTHGPKRRNEKQSLIHSCWLSQVKYANLI